MSKTPRERLSGFWAELFKDTKLRKELLITDDGDTIVVEGLVRLAEQVGKEESLADHKAEIKRAIADAYTLGGRHTGALMPTVNVNPFKNLHNDLKEVLDLYTKYGIEE